MKINKKVIYLFVFTLCCLTNVAQNNNVQINLDIKRLPVNRIHVRFSLYQDSLYYISFKAIPMNNLKTKGWMKRNSDKILEINEIDFKEIENKIKNLSYTNILKGMNLSNDVITNDGTGVTLEFVFSSDKVVYDITNPWYYTKDRNLKEFLAICKQIIKLAKKNFNDYF